MKRIRASLQTLDSALSITLNSHAATIQECGTSARLSIPNLVDRQAQQVRLAETRAFASRIANEKRTWPIAGVEYPFYDGPVARPGSLAQTIQEQQVARLNEFENTDSTALYQIIMQSSFSTEEGYQAFYNKATALLPKPMSTDTSDESFGYQRLTIKGFSMRAFDASKDALPSDPSLQIGANIANICGGKHTSVESVAKSNKLFVSDFSNFGKWSNRPDGGGGSKHVAPVVAFFCYNEDRQKLLPLAIHVVDTSLTYTPFDRPDEWTLAKMAVDTAEVNFQQMQHLADSHAVLAPVSVETLRHLAPTHPVSALLLRVSAIDFGIEKLAADVLFSEATVLDFTFGFGAVGCIEFLANQMQYSSIKNDFGADIKSRGLEHLPIHKYARYGQLYHDALEEMATSYLKAYYPSDKAVAEDMELQNWAVGCSVVSQLRDFPKQFTSVHALQKMLTHLIFQTTVRHHAMNGAVSWQSVSAPYSTPALWKPLPTKKLADGETLNILEYSTPIQLLPMLVVLGYNFARHVPESESLSSLFKASPFTDEPKLARVASDFGKSLRSIDALMTAVEESEQQPYDLLRPSMLALNGWV